MDFEFQIFVQRPLIESAAPVKVVLSTDANLTFGFMSNAIQMLTAGGEIPSLLSVGIGYTPNPDPTYVATRRTFDFSPVEDQVHQSALAASGMTAGGIVRAGGGPQFLRFICEELWPWIAKNYNVSEDRTYVGDSMGGLFGVYALFNRPGFFSRYVLGSPWLSWAHPLSFEYEAAFAEKNKDLDATVFLACGGAEDEMSPAFPSSVAKLFKDAQVQARTEQLARLLTKRNYPNLRLKSVVFPEETHFTVPFALIPHGLRYVFQR